MARAFVIRPFETKKDSSGREINFEQVHNELIAPALEAADLGGTTTGEIVDSGNIREDMFALIIEADLVVCDITVHNANVFYELGIRHALRRKRTILIKGQPTNDSTPFDLLTDRYLSYDIDNPALSKDKLIASIIASLRSERATDSPVFQMLPSLAEADPSQVQVVPLDFLEEVARARAAQAKGWLRLLSTEVIERRFKWEGLKLVATAQWKVKDYRGACRSWEAVRETNPKDIAANLSLANIYERLYRHEKRPELMEASDQAIERVLGNSWAGREERTEALTLRGRNQKTRWRLEFSDLENLKERRRAAMNRALIRSYQAYRAAFLEDLNHFYPGLSGLQMGTILLDLSREEMWYAAFDNDRQAEDYRAELAQQVSTLRALVPASVSAYLGRINQRKEDRVWAEVSKADVLFLTDERRRSRILGAYRDAIPKCQAFAWDAARGQLQLFADLGIKADLAAEIISQIDSRMAGRKLSEGKKPVHLVLFVGHRVDAPGRQKPRFPALSEDQAKALIRCAVEKLLDQQCEVVGLASAASGADILWHEVCSELGLTSIICLPMPASDFACLAYKNLDSWRGRFLELKRHRQVLELSHRAGLPRWLDGTEVDPWERGNRWVMQMALSWQADRITLVALWDSREEGEGPGGTAHMVQLARDAGTVDIVTLDAKQLVG